MIEAIRQWAARHTAERRYSPVGVAFHWTMAALITFQLYWGWHMGRVPIGADKLEGYRLHSELGLLMLVLAVLRLLWRTIVPGPVNDADKLGWQTKLAYITHGLFYICFFGLPLSGWAMWSALGDGPDLSLAGVPWPQMPFHDVPIAVQWAVLDWAEGIHALLVICLLVMVPLHAGAAIKHHFWDKHDVLIGMLPELKADEPAEGQPRHGLQAGPPPPASAPG
ncbi:cytochrome b [Novosphingobium sp. AP12]|uniref:cytochrome b n=1 Tax=Novosphingobium sp. AP12 TaxID=1144305 RepID=UPI0002721E6B|nr:cytochrome b [Novosphingobium sp. AP12]EJL35078.1 cytochrome B561 [Novosphingobium sp. AP12]